MTETELDGKVYRLCRKLGVARFRKPAGLGAAGWPDLVLWRRRLIFRELKSGAGRVSRAQQALGRSLLVAGQDWGVWRPADLESGRIERELQGL